ncbi:hypothetical protein DFP91_5884, partial [Pseudorhodoplanes sinuspersici]
VASAGPMSEDVARELLAEVEADIASAYEQEARPMTEKKLSG